MFEGDRVLGVDPGIATTGLAVVDRGPLVRWSGTVRTPSGLGEPARLRLLHDAVRQAVAEHRVATMAVERVMWGRNVGSAMSVARATGVVLLAAAEAGVAVEEYAPLEVKMAVTGNGTASKDQVRTALSRLFGIEAAPGADAADAVAVALCHLQQARLKAATR